LYHLVAIFKSFFCKNTLSNLTKKPIIKFCTLNYIIASDTPNSSRTFAAEPASRNTNNIFLIITAFYPSSFWSNASSSVCEGFTASIFPSLSSRYVLGIYSTFHTPATEPFASLTCIQLT